jgi:hypothetical protein
MESEDNRRLPDVPAPEPIQELFPLVVGYRISQAIYVVAKLGIPDLLASGPQDSEALAQATGIYAGALYRVLRFLAGVGLFDETLPRTFGLTPLGARLRMDAPGSTRPSALMLLDPPLWQAWGSLLHTVQTGETAFEHVHGQSMFDYLDTHRDSASVFQQSMTSNTAWSGMAITRAYDFSGLGTLVDVGGGQGLLLATILQAYPAMRGVLFDRPEVVASAPAVLGAAGVADRCTIVGGDFFAGVPPGGRCLRLAADSPRLGRHPGGADPRAVPSRARRIGQSAGDRARDCTRLPPGAPGLAARYGDAGQLWWHPAHRGGAPHPLRWSRLAAQRGGPARRRRAIQRVRGGACLVEQQHIRERRR